MSVGLEMPSAEALIHERARVEEDPRRAAQSPRVLARWVGGDASRIECDDAVITLGGQKSPGPMEALLAALAACEIDVVATHAAALGMQIERLTAEVTGGFDLRAYLGFDDAPRPGLTGVSCVLRATMPGATPQQARSLRERCERSSPVADSLARNIPLEISLESGSA